VVVRCLLRPDNADNTVTIVKKEKGEYQSSLVGMIVYIYLALHTRVATSHAMLKCTMLYFTLVCCAVAFKIAVGLSVGDCLIGLIQAKATTPDSRSQRRQSRKPLQT